MLAGTHCKQGHFKWNDDVICAWKTRLVNGMPAVHLASLYWWWQIHYWSLKWSLHIFSSWKYFYHCIKNINCLYEVLLVHYTTITSKFRNRQVVLFLQVSLLIRRELTERAKDFNIILDDVSIVCTLRLVDISRNSFPSFKVKLKHKLLQQYLDN